MTKKMIKNSFDLSTLKSNEILALGQQYIRDEVRCSGSVKSITHNWTVSCGEILPTFAVDECFFTGSLAEPELFS